jgi:hypothetical protein
MNADWLKHFLAAKKPMDPGISAMVSLADVLGIDRLDLMEAVAADALGGKRQGRDAVLREVSKMSPQEVAAFLVSPRGRH